MAESALPDPGTPFGARVPRRHRDLHGHRAPRRCSADDFGQKFPVPLRIEITRTRGR